MEERKKIINRLRTIKGHVEGVEKMILDEKPCEDVLVQIAAIRSAVNNVGIEILKNNAKNCFHREGIDKEEFSKIMDSIIKFSK